MGATTIDWLAPLAVLGASLVAGALLVLRTYSSARYGGRRPQAAPLVRRDLLARRDVLLDQLRELQDTSSKRTPEQLARERYGVELAAATILLELEPASPLPRRPPRKTGARRASAEAVSPVAEEAGRRGLLWTAAGVATIVLLLLLVYRSARPRAEGDAVTGDPKMEAPAGGPSQIARFGSADAREGQLKAAVARNPEDVEARLELARIYLVKEDLRSAWDETQEVLKRAPADARALSYQGLIRLAGNQPEVALALLQTAIARKPDLFEAYPELALVFMRLGRPADAEATMAVAARRFPAKAAVLSRLFARMREETEKATGPRAAVDARADARAPATGRAISGVVDLDVALRHDLAPGAVVWVTVRRAGFEGGPPVAVKRLSASGFPIAFSIGESDTMAGEPFPETVRIEARVDSDGDPTTRDARDASARADGIPAGAVNVRLPMTR